MASTLLAVLLLLVVAPSSPATVVGGSDPSQARPLVRDLTGYEDRTSVVSPAELTLPEQATGIGPGSHLLIKDIPGKEGFIFSCTANFVWQDGDAVYLGAAGHCFLPPDATATHGAGPHADLSQVKVRVCVDQCSFGGFTGFFRTFTGTTVSLGPVAYARQTGPEGDLGPDVGNDFGLVEVPADLGPLLRPSMPVFGGPVTTGVIDSGDPVCHYGAGVVVGETWPTMGRVGVGDFTEKEQGWWSAVAASMPGDSGSAVQVCAPTANGVEGQAAAGILTHGIGIAGVPVPGLALGTTVDKAVEMAKEARLSISIVFEGGDGGEEPAPEPGGVTVSGVDPDTIGTGTTQVTVSGDGFEPGVSLSLSGGRGPTPTASVTDVSSDGTSLVADITVQEEGPHGSSTWDVTVTNPDGSSGTLPDGLTVVR